MSIYKNLPTVASEYTGVYTYQNGGSAEFIGSKFPSIIRYNNGEWIRIADDKVVEIHTLETIEEYARDYAMKEHGEQMYGDKPYIFHLQAVRQVLADFEFSGLILVASWLHDVVEDTNATKEDIGKRFGPVVEEYVWGVTGVGRNRKERNESMYDKATRTPRIIPLKLADRIANVENAAKHNPALLEMYRREYQTFRERLMPLSKEFTSMWERLHKAIWSAHK